MTIRSNARIAGVAFLVYIAFGLSAVFLSRAAGGGEAVASKLASIAAHASERRVAILFEVVECFCALVLAVTLYAITRDVDADLALLAGICRIAEGVVSGVALQRSAGKLWLATAAGPDAPDSGAASTLAAVLLKLPDRSMEVGATFFAVGSTIFAYLLLRGRMVPAALAWIGLLGSLLAVAVLPLQLVGILGSPITDIIWIPLLVYEVWLALWLILKGVALPQGRAQA